MVTGSTSGIGNAMAAKLAEAGANIVLHGLMDALEGEALRQEFENRYGIECLFSNADISNAAGNEQLVADALKKFGQVDILINNAGIQYTAFCGRFSGSEVGFYYSDQPELSLSHHTVTGSRYAETGLGADY